MAPLIFTKIGENQEGHIGLEAYFFDHGFLGKFSKKIMWIFSEHDEICILVLRKGDDGLRHCRFDNYSVIGNRKFLEPLFENFLVFKLAFRHDKFLGHMENLHLGVP